MGNLCSCCFGGEDENNNNNSNSNNDKKNRKYERLVSENSSINISPLSNASSNNKSSSSSKNKKIINEDSIIQELNVINNGATLIFSFTISNGPQDDEYNYAIEQPPKITSDDGKYNVGSGNLGMDEEYIEFRRNLPRILEDHEFKSNIASYAKMREDQYNNILQNIIQQKYSKEAKIIVMKIQEEPEDAFAPCRIGTFVLIWNPMKERSLSMSMSERSLGVPLVFQTLIDWMKKKNIIHSGYLYIRDATTIRDEEIQYSNVYRQLFKRAHVLAVATQGSFVSKRS